MAVHIVDPWPDPATVRGVENTFPPMSSPFLRKVILRLCTSDRPYPIGRDEAVLAKSNHDFGRFPGTFIRIPEEMICKRGKLPSGAPALATEEEEWSVKLR